MRPANQTEHLNNETTLLSTNAKPARNDKCLQNDVL